MSIIALRGVPCDWNLIDIAKRLAKVIKESFEPLNFVAKQQGKSKRCFIQLSEKLDPVNVVEKINSSVIIRTLNKKNKTSKIVAFIPNSVPDIPLPKMKPKFNKKKGKKFTKQKNTLPHEVLITTHHELLSELQYKYPDLFNLSAKTNHKLLKEISVILYERLKPLMESNSEVRSSCFKLSSMYRRRHPHFGDFQLILSTLHSLQDAAGAPRIHITEQELATFNPLPFAIGDVPLGTVKRYCKTYTENICQVIKEHVKSWEGSASDGSEENTARKKVRDELKKMMPYLPTMISQITLRHFKPEEIPNHRVKLYGEPFLPQKAVLLPFLKLYVGTAKVSRSNTMYNLVKFNIPQKDFMLLLAMDGSLFHGAKLIIRNDMPIFDAPIELRREMCAAFGGPSHYKFIQQASDEEEDDEYDEN